jgi:hypothetical protein
LVSETNYIIMFIAYRHAGCYKDDLLLHAVPWLIGIFPHNTAVSNCAYAAKQKGYKGFAVQAGMSCYGGSSGHHESSYAKYGKSDACGGGVGGFLANDVYIFY